MYIVENSIGNFLRNLIFQQLYFESYLCTLQSSNLICQGSFNTKYSSHHVFCVLDFYQDFSLHFGISLYTSRIAISYQVLFLKLAERTEVITGIKASHFPVHLWLLPSSSASPRTLRYPTHTRI